jgi:ribosomal protein L7/L12
VVEIATIRRFLWAGKPTPLILTSDSEAWSMDDHQIQALVAQDKKIQAIERVREQTGWGLKQAKDYVDALEPLPTSEEPA